MGNNKDRSEPGNEATNDRSYRGDAPGKIGVTSDNQPNLVAPSGVNQRDPGSTGGGPSDSNKRPS